MPRCDLCGKDAGFLKKRHKECEARQKEGLSQVTALARDAALGKVSPRVLRAQAKALAQASFIPDSELPSLYVWGFELAVEEVLADSVLSEAEEEHINSFLDETGLTQDKLDKQGAFTKLAQARVIREVIAGKLPDTNLTIRGDIPFNFQKGETLIWMFQQVRYCEQRTTTRYQGSYQGVSLRVAKGVYYRTGGFRGNPIPVSQLVHVATGLLAVTSKHIYFTGESKSFRIPYAKIVSIQPYSDGIGVQRDAASARPQLFITSDGWFIYNLVSNLARSGAA